MANPTINFTSMVNGTLVDVTSIHLEDEDDTFGVRRVDTLAVVVASGTVVPRLSLGTYAYTFTDPEPGLSYEYTLKVVYAGKTYYYNRQNMAGDSNSLLTIPSSSHYTSQSEIYRILGEYATQLMIEDYSSGDQSYMWSDLLYNVDSTIHMYVGQHYNPDNLYSNRWVRRRATTLAANILSQRRGNAPIFVGMTERVYEELNMIRDNRFHIPGATVRAWQGPIVRNYEMQSLVSSRHPGRVQSTKSTSSGTYAGEDLAYEPFIFNYRL